MIDCRRVIGRRCGPKRRCRYRIIAARMPRMAFAQASGGQRAAFQRAVRLYCLDRVMGAAREKPAFLRAEKRADAQLVSAQQHRQERFHGVGSGRRCAENRRVSSDRSSVFRLAQVAGPRLELTGCDRRTIQSMPGSAVCRNSSRATRLMVLRVTARGANRLAATTPNRAWES